MAVALCVFTVVVVMTVMTGLVGDFKQKNHAFAGDCVVGTESLVGFPYYEEFMELVEQTGIAEGVSPVVKSYALFGTDRRGRRERGDRGARSGPAQPGDEFRPDAELPRQAGGESVCADVRSECSPAALWGSTG